MQLLASERKHDPTNVIGHIVNPSIYNADELVEYYFTFFPTRVNDAITGASTCKGPTFPNVASSIVFLLLFEMNKNYTNPAAIEGRQTPCVTMTHVEAR